MTWLFVGILIGLLSHRGYLKFIEWHRTYRLKKVSRGIAIAIVKAQEEELYDAYRSNYRNHAVNHRV